MLTYFIQGLTFVIFSLILYDNIHPLYRQTWGFGFF